MVRITAKIPVHHGFSIGYRVAQAKALEKPVFTKGISWPIR